MSLAPVADLQSQMLFPLQQALLQQALLQQALLVWFDSTGRDLPWRLGEEGRRDPYRVWVAEILLQQTQVSRGLIYYQRFLEAFPTVQALAAAPQEDVLKAWEGCGYYARARNLHKAAKVVAQQGFPADYEGWLKLSGVGPYTAAAIASLAFAEQRAVNDGNVRRVLARLFANKQPTENWVQAQATALLASNRAGAWNEAVMDLGATICTPKAPQCLQCPLVFACAAHATGNPTQFPAPKLRATVKNVSGVALLIGDEQEAVLERRTGKLLGGLMGLPMEFVVPAPVLEQEGAAQLDTAQPDTAAQALARLCKRFGIKATDGLLGEVQHTMTHRQISLQVYWVKPQPYLAALTKLTQGPKPQPVALQALSRLDQKALRLLQQTQNTLFVGRS